jgi:acyl-CoA thioesterase I
MPARDLSRRAMLLAGLAVATHPMPARAQGRPPRVVMLGDSITAGFGLRPGEALPDRLQAALRARGRAATIENAGVSGDTASGGRDRLDWAVGDGADAVIVALGGNDMLRGIDPAVTERALDDILSRLAARRVPTLLAGMRASRSLGQAYVAAFEGLYPRLAARHGAALYPFLLDGVAGEPRLNQPDGIHPNTAGVAVIVERLLPAVEALLDRSPR